MCSSKAKVVEGIEAAPLPAVARINGRPVLQPTCNRVPNNLERRNSMKKLVPPSPLPPPSKTSLTPPISPKSKSPRLITINNNNNNDYSKETQVSDEKPTNVVVTTTTTTTTRNYSKKAPSPSLERMKKSKSFKEGSYNYNNLSYCSSLITESPGSIAAVRREQVALQQAQRKMKIAHYGRSKSAKFEREVVKIPLLDHHASSNILTTTTKTTSDHHDQDQQHKRCSFITANSDPIYVAYHDEEWGVPEHDDKMLFELLVLSGAQVGSDWTSILKKRQDFRTAFSEFDAEIVANLTEKQMISISSEYGIDISRVRGVVDNANRILEIKKDFGTFDKYIWGFVNHKPISTQYKFGHKILVKTSKSESISKDMVRRNFRFVGSTVVHSFMQAAGITNDHLITCHRHLHCTLIAACPNSVTKDLSL